MGRLLLLLLIVVAIVLLWKAFAPKSMGGAPRQQPQIKGPDDDEAFLWKLEKEQFKRRREAENQQRLNGKPEQEKDPGQG